LTGLKDSDRIEEQWQHDRKRQYREGELTGSGDVARWRQRQDVGERQDMERYKMEEGSSRENLTSKGKRQSFEKYRIEEKRKYGGRICRKKKQTRGKEQPKEKANV
jgi:hypothetical protein